MQDGFVRVACATPNVKVADCRHNIFAILEKIETAEKENVQILVFPELSLTAYTCQDLFLNQDLLNNALKSLQELADLSQHCSLLYFVGLPLAHQGKIYNVAAAVQKGKILAFIPKQNLPNYDETNELRYFTSGKNITEVFPWQGQSIPLTPHLLFSCPQFKNLRVAAEICEDLWVADSPSLQHAMAGANLIVNLSAGIEIAGKAEYRRTLLKGHSGKIIAAYAYCNAGLGESTTDAVFAGHQLIAENGYLLAESPLFKNTLTIQDIDIDYLTHERQKQNTFIQGQDAKYSLISFDLEKENTNIIRTISKTPFIPTNPDQLKERASLILNLQAQGLCQRLRHINCQKVCLGISGGLDSTLALLVTIIAFELLNLPKKNIMTVTMPGFGTSDRTYENAVKLVQQFDTDFHEISIVPAILQHFKDIKHDPDVHDAAYENAQARERTQILMDLANQHNAIVVGTGDLSELALGFATFNGDHMAMYGVNASVPKTLVRHLVHFYAKDIASTQAELSATLLDILATPVSPELLPSKNGEIVQKTEDLVGPYELHDFFLYHFCRYGCNIPKIRRLAQHAFQQDYDAETIERWLNCFLKQFFAHQFKRSCLPDGPRVGSVCLSPRGGFLMPSDASASLWLDILTE